MATDERITGAESKSKTEVYEKFKFWQKGCVESTEGLLDEELQGW